MSSLPTGSVITCTDEKVMKELAILCSFVCVCEKTPISKGKKNYKQNCVDAITEGYLSINKDSPIVPEAPYYVGKYGTVIPLLRNARDTVSWRRSIYAAKLAITVADGKLDIEKMYSYVDRTIPLKELKGVLLDEGVDYSQLNMAGILKKPDAVILDNPKGSLSPSNVAGIAEIKFPPDSWDEEQYEAYRKIVNGDKDKIHTLTPESCMCKDGKSNYEAARVPAAAHAAEKQYLTRRDTLEALESTTLPGLAPPPKGAQESLATAALTALLMRAAMTTPYGRALIMPLLLLNTPPQPPEA